jgi:hypothetical protein
VRPNGHMLREAVKYTAEALRPVTKNLAIQSDGQCSPVAGEVGMDDNIL